MFKMMPKAFCDGRLISCESLGPKQRFRKVKLDHTMKEEYDFIFLHLFPTVIIAIFISEMNDAE